MAHGYSPVSAPFVVGLIVACVLVALLTGLGGGGPLLRALVFADPFQVVDDTFAQRLAAITFNLENYQWWRFFTPAILHFSVLHIVFNMLWLWYLGAMVEIKQGRFRMVMLFALTALVSNAAQYLQTGPFLVVCLVLSMDWLAIAGCGINAIPLFLSCPMH